MDSNEERSAKRDRRDYDRPLCVSVIICNEIIEDKRTNNKTLVSLFNTVAVSKFPCVHPKLSIMASLTNGAGKWPVSFSIKSPAGAEIWRFDAEALFADPLAVVDIAIEVGGLPLAEPGTYFVDVLTESYPLGNRRFSVHQIGGDSPPPMQGLSAD